MSQEDLDAAINLIAAVNAGVVQAIARWETAPLSVKLSQPFQYLESGISLSTGDLQVNRELFMQLLGLHREDT